MAKVRTKPKVGKIERLSGEVKELNRWREAPGDYFVLIEQQYKPLSKDEYFLYNTKWIGESHHKLNLVPLLQERMSLRKEQGFTLVETKCPLDIVYNYHGTRKDGYRVDIMCLRKKVSDPYEWAEQMADPFYDPEMSLRSGEGYKPKEFNEAGIPCPSVRDLKKETARALEDHSNKKDPKPKFVSVKVEEEEKNGRDRYTPPSSREERKIPDGIYKCPIGTRGDYRMLRVRTQPLDDKFEPGKQLVAFDKSDTWENFAFLSHTGVYGIWKRFKPGGEFSAAGESLERAINALLDDPKGCRYGIRRNKDEERLRDLYHKQKRLILSKDEVREMMRLRDKLGENLTDEERRNLSL